MSLKHQGQVWDGLSSAVACYCIFAMVIVACTNLNFAVSQEQDSVSSAKKSNNDELIINQSKGENADRNSKSASSSGQELSALKSNLPVVAIQTNSKSEFLDYQKGPFDVVAPDWYEKRVEGQPNEDFYRMMGADDQLLQKEMDAELQSKVNEYVDQLLGDGAHRYVIFTKKEKERIVSRSEKVTGIYFDGKERIPYEFGYVQVKFDDDFKRQAKDKWTEKRQTSRLMQFGLVAVGAILLISAVFGGLKLNSATSGFYQGRLQFFVGLVILGVVAAGVFLGSQLDWI